jgi:hypothetical protein
MRPEDVVSPISLPPTSLEQFQKAWVLYLEREGITTDRQPKVTDVADYCFAMGIAFTQPQSPTNETEERPTVEPEEKKPRHGFPVLTPEQDALAKAPWTREDVAAWKQHCAQGTRGNPEIYPERYTAREQTNFIRARRGVPLLPPDPPKPMIWEKGQYTGMKGIGDYQPANDGFKRPGSFSTS